MKNYTLLGLIGIIVILFSVIIFKNCRVKKLEIQQAIEPILAPVQQKIDKKGNQYVEIKEELFTKAQVKHISDSLIKVYKVSKIDGVVKQVQHIDTFSREILVFIDTGTHEIRAVDSNRYIINVFKGNTKTNTGQFHLTLTPDTLSYIDAVKTHFFKPNEHNIIISHSSPYIKTTNASAYKYKEPKVQFCIGPSAGVQYSPIDGKFHGYLGLGITLNLISIKSK